MVNIQATKAKTDKEVYVNLKSFNTAKTISNSTKRTLMEWEEILTNHITDKVLISKIDKDLLQLNSRGKKKHKINIKTWAKDFDISPKTQKWSIGT